METTSAASKIQANLHELFKAKTTSGNSYIRFYLNQDLSALLAMDQVEESLLVEAEQITPLPSMPKSVIGIMNSRDRVFCVFDLAEIINLPSSLIAPRQYQVIVLKTDSEEASYVGLAVSRFLGMDRFDQAQIASLLSNLPEPMQPYVLGTIEQEYETVPILDWQQIIKALSNQ